MTNHIDTGIRKVLNLAWVYRLYQNLVKKSWSDQYYVDHYIQPKEKISILDIGCGDCHFLELYPEDINYYGFDMNPNYIKKAKEKFQKRGTFICAPVSKEALPQNLKFDVITANALFHHISDEDLQLLFASVTELLKPGGYLVSLDPVYIPNQNFISKTMIKLDRGQNIRDEKHFKELGKPFFTKIETYYENNFYNFPFDLIINKFYI